MDIAEELYNSEPENEAIEQTEVVEVIEREDDNQAEEEEQKTEVKLKRVRNPQPKFNAETLKGERGIHILPEQFGKLRFKGPGHEEDDLNLLMKNYEHWCHRLFPSFAFDDALEKLESLGHKKPVQTHIKKIRLDMLTDDAYVSQEVVSDKEDDDHIDTVPDTFDNIITVPDPFDNVVSQAVSDQPVVELTEEQEERIRENRERALRIRMEKLQKARVGDNSNNYSE